jgi:hypothetical protein
MVLLILTREGYADVQSLVATSVVWVNHDVLTQTEIMDLRAKGVDLTTFTSWLEPNDSAAVQSAVDTIAEHHPGDRIWIETQFQLTAMLT